MIRSAWLACLVGGVAACGAAEETPSPGRGKDWNLVVVVLDTLRASGVGAWGYERDTTPNLDALAARGVRFSETYATASYTLASVSSLFTGLSPATHGVVGLDSNVLADGHATLAEVLAGAGFRTAGFSANPHITMEGGFAQGFGEFRHYKRARLDKHVVQKTLVRDALAWWDANAGERRFLYVHVLPPHQPYDAPAPHDALFGAGETRRELGLTDWLVAADREQRVKPNTAEARAIRSRYDAGVHHSDDFLGRFLEALGDAPETDTAVCVLSDHGEAFAEHGRLLHGTTVFDEMVHVPLVISWPGVEPAVVDELVSLRDLAPTLCELLDVPWIASEERSFLGAVWRDLPDRPVISRSVGNFPVWSLRTPEWTLMHQPKKGVRLLYDRDADRGETVELLQRKGGWQQRSSGRTLDEAELRALGRELLQDLRDRLEDLRRRSRVAPGADDTHRDAIEDMGYLEIFDDQRPDAAPDDDA